MSKCKFVFFDEYGKPSDVYQSAKEEFGEKEAEEIYIRHMLRSSGLRFDADSTIRKTDLSTLNEWEKTIKDPSGDSYPTTDGLNLERTSNVIKNFQEGADDFDVFGGKVQKGKEVEKDEDTIMLEMAELHMPKFLATKYEKTAKLAADVKQTTIDNFKRDKPEEYDEILHYIVNKWKAGRDAGTATHEYIELVLKELQKLRDKATKNGEALTGASLKTAINKRIKGQDSISEAAIRKIRKKYKPLMDRVGRRYLERAAEDIVDHIDVVEKRLGLEPGQLIIRPEQRVANLKMGSKGMAGTIDILLVNPYGNSTHILDIKTKTDESLQNFYRLVKKKIGGTHPYTDNNAAGSATVQMSHYAAMLEAANYTTGTYNEVIIIKGDVKEDENDSSKPLSKRGFVYINPEVSSIEKLPNDAGTVWEAHTNEDYAQLIEDRRGSGLTKTIADWSKGQAVPYRSNEKHYVESRINELTFDEESGTYAYVDKNPFNETQWSTQHLDQDQYDDKEYLYELFSGEYKQFMRDKLTLPTRIAKYFQTKDPKARKKMFGHRQKAVNTLLAGFSPETHTIIVAHTQFPNMFGDIGDDILIVVDNNDENNVSFLSVNSAKNIKLKFHENDETDYLGKNKATSIFGNFIKDTDQRLMKSIPAEIRQASHANDLSSIKLAAASARWKQKNPSMKIVRMGVGSILGDEYQSVESTSLAAELSKIKVFQELVPPSDFPKIFTEILEDKRVNNPEIYEKDTLQRISQIITKSLYERGLDGSSLQAYNIATSDVGKRIDENIKKRARGMIVDQALIADLTKILNSLLEDGPISLEDKAKNEDIKLVSAALLQLSNIEMNSKQIFGKKISELQYLSSETTAHDVYVQKIGLQRDKYTNSVRIQFQSFNREHDKYFNALLKANGVNTTTGVGMNKIWKRLMRVSVNDKGVFNPNKQKDWMMLKDPETDGKNLKQAEKDYINFFNKNIKEALIKGSLNTRQIEGIENDQYLPKGLMPIMHKPKGINTKGTLKDFVVSLTKWVLPTPKKTGEKKSDEVQMLMYNSNFKEEVTNAGLQNSDSRLGKLGISGDTGKSIPHGEIETSLPVILSTVVMDSLNTEHIGKLNTLVNATVVGLMDMELTKNINTESTRKFIQALQHMLIHNQYNSGEGDWGKALDILGQSASRIIFTASVRQALIEFSTAWIQGTSSMMANGINKFLFRTKDEDIWFAPKDWLWAGKAWFSGTKFNAKAEMMVLENGMLHPDPENLASNDYTKHDKNRLWKSKLGWGMNRFSIENVLVQTFMAYARHKGFDNSYIKDPATGKFTYDETKDKRFYVYEEGLGYGQTRPPQTDEERTKNLLWKSVRNEIKAEGMLYTKADADAEPNSNYIVEGKMKYPLSNIERKTLKQYGTRLFGSMSKDSIVMLDFFAYGRAMSRYKRWFYQKVKNYWTPRHKSESYQTRRIRHTEAFEPLMQGNVHIELGKNLVVGDTELTIPEDVILEPGDILQFGTAPDSVSYTIEERTDNKVVLNKPIEKDVSKGAPIFIKYELGRHEWVNEDYEGILQTVGNMTKGLFMEGVSSTLGKFNRVQKDNISKLLADMFMLMLGMLLSKFLLDNEDIAFTQTDMGKTISKAFGNAYGELNIFATAYTMTDNIFPALSTLGAIADTFHSGVASTIHGDSDAAVQYLVRAGKTAGFYRSISDISNLFIEQDK